MITMKNIKKFTYKLAALTCVASFCVMLFPSRPAAASAVPVYEALQWKVIEGGAVETAKAEIIDFATAAGYNANAQSISTTSAVKAGKLTSRIGSICFAALAVVEGFNQGTNYAYEQMSDGFKVRFTYEECLNYMWKKAFGADDLELLSFFYTALDPEYVDDFADGLATFEYNLNLSGAITNTLYEAYFNNVPYAENYIAEHYGVNYFENYSEAPFIASGWKNWLPADSFFPAETYIKGATEYLSQAYPDFAPDFFTISCPYMLEYGPRYSPARDGYNGDTRITAIDFPDDGGTPIFLYNPSSGLSNLTTYEDPSYDTLAVTADCVHVYGYTYPGLYTADFYSYGIYFKEDGPSSVTTSGFHTNPVRYRVYKYDEETNSQTQEDINPASYGHFISFIQYNVDSIYGLPVYTLVDGSLVPYSLKAEAPLSEPTGIYPPSTSGALYNPSIPENGKIEATVPEIDSYVNTSGEVVQPAPDAEEIPDTPSDPGTETPPTYDDGTPIFPVFPDFSDFLTGERNELNLLEKLSSFLSKCLNLLPDGLVESFWWIFVFTLAIALISVLI